MPGTPGTVGVTSTVTAEPGIDSVGGSSRIELLPGWVGGVRPGRHLAIERCRWYFSLTVLGWAVMDVVGVGTYGIVAEV